MASTAEAELGALFENSKEVVSLRLTRNKFGHHQPATPIQVDNSTAHRIEPGRNNKADYFTKHHPPAHHKK
eukprot:14692323-Ditylum_brightwellii.AAC.1